MCRLAQTWRRPGLIGCLRLTFRERHAGPDRDAVKMPQPFGPVGVIRARPIRRRNSAQGIGARGIQMNKMNSRARSGTLAMPAGLPLKSYLAAAAIALALLAAPHSGHAQGIVGGAQEGAREGNSAAGPR